MFSNLVTKNLMWAVLNVQAVHKATGLPTLF